MQMQDQPLMNARLRRSARPAVLALVAASLLTLLRYGLRREDIE